MVLLKVNEIQCNSNGITLKANKNELKAWTRNIDEYYKSLGYTVVTKDLSNNGKQHTYLVEQSKFIFEFYSTGRIVVRTKDMERLQHEFIDNHEHILGVKLESIANKPVTVVAAKSKPICSAPVSPRTNSSTPIQSDGKSAPVKPGKTASDAFDFTRGRSGVHHRADDDVILGLRSEIADLREEIELLKATVRELQSKDARESSLPRNIESIVKQVLINLNMNFDDTEKSAHAEPQKERKELEEEEEEEKEKIGETTDSDAQKPPRETSEALKSTPEPVKSSSTYVNLSGVAHTSQGKSVKYLTEQFQKLTTIKSPRNK